MELIFEVNTLTFPQNTSTRSDLVHIPDLGRKSYKGGGEELPLARGAQPPYHSGLYSGQVTYSKLDHSPSAVD